MILPWMLWIVNTVVHIIILLISRVSQFSVLTLLFREGPSSNLDIMEIVFSIATIFGLPESFYQIIRHLALY
jgi:hypothetical protein